MSRLLVIGGSLSVASAGGGGGGGVTAPNTLAAVATANRIALTWVDASNNETGFAVYRSTTGTGNPTTNSGDWTLIATAAENAVSIDPQTLSYSTTYYYIIRATGYGGTPPSAWSEKATVTTDDLPEASPLRDYNAAALVPGLFPLQLGGQAEPFASGIGYPIVESFSFN